MAEKLALGCEYEWHEDASRDPFAKLAGLVWHWWPVLDASSVRV